MPIVEPSWRVAPLWALPPSVPQSVEPLPWQSLFLRRSKLGVREDWLALWVGMELGKKIHDWLSDSFDSIQSIQMVFLIRWSIWSGKFGSRLSKTALIFIYIYNNILHILYIYVLVHKVIFFLYIYIYSYIIQHVCFSFSIFISLHSFLELLPSQVLALPNSVLPLSSSALAAIFVANRVSLPFFDANLATR